MADFGGLASVLQMQNQSVTSAPKQTKQHSRKRSLEGNDDPNARVNSKLLQLLKENQEDFRVINGTTNSDPSNQIAGGQHAAGGGGQMLMNDFQFDYQHAYDENDPNYVIN